MLALTSCCVWRYAAQPPPPPPPPPPSGEVMEGCVLHNLLFLIWLALLSRTDPTQVQCTVHRPQATVHNALHSTLHYKHIQYTLHCTRQYGTHRSRAQCTPPKSMTLHCTALHCIGLRNTTLHCTALICTPVHCS